MARGEASARSWTECQRLIHRDRCFVLHCVPKCCKYDTLLQNTSPDAAENNQCFSRIIWEHFSFCWRSLSYTNNTKPVLHEQHETCPTQTTWSLSYTNNTKPVLHKQHEASPTRTTRSLFYTNNTKHVLHEQHEACPTRRTRSVSYTNNTKPVLHEQHETCPTRTTGNLSYKNKEPREWRIDAVWGLSRSESDGMGRTGSVLSYLCKVLIISSGRKHYISTLKMKALDFSEFWCHRPQEQSIPNNYEWQCMLWTLMDTLSLMVKTYGLWFRNPDGARRYMYNCHACILSIADQKLAIEK
jgi:hypothetical protein